MLFRYSGNKSNLLRSYRDLAEFPVPSGVRRLVEPYLGSGAFSLKALQAGVPSALGLDIDPNVIGLWQWLQQPGVEDELDALQEWYNLQTEKLDIRKVEELSEGQRLYLKINVCGAYVGQWSSWSIYPLQHRLPTPETLKWLLWARKVEVRQAPASEYEPQEGDAVFIDPPYVGTSGNYGKFPYDPDETIELVDRCVEAGVPVLCAYGDRATELFPDWDWEQAAVRLVPNLRHGGTVERREYLARIGWPPGPPTVFDLFGVE